MSGDGGGGGTYYRARPPKLHWKPQKWGLVWLAPISSKGNDIAWTNGGGERIIGGTRGRSKTVSGEGSYGTFSHPLSFRPSFLVL